MGCFIESDGTTVLSSHDPPADGVLSEWLLFICDFGGGVEATSLSLPLQLVLLLLQLLLDDLIHFLLETLVLQAHLWESVSWVETFTVMIVLRVHGLVHAHSMNTIVCVIKLLISLNGFFKLQMLLGDVLSNDGSTDACESAERSLLVPVPDECALGDGICIRDVVEARVGRTAAVTSNSFVENVLCHFKSAL